MPGTGMKSKYLLLIINHNITDALSLPLFLLSFQATIASTARSPSASATLALGPPITMWAGMSVGSPSQGSGNHRPSTLEAHPALPPR